jgi:flagellar biogenesis protein FliO
VTITLEADSYAQESTSVFGVVSLILFILMVVFICICVGAIIRICMRKRQMEEERRLNE